MTNNIQLFNYGESPVRTIIQDGEVWFVAKDVCDILGLNNVTEALKALDNDEKGSLRVTEGTSSKGGNPNMNIINESGLYTLIFKSTKPEAKTFRKWVTSEVLPAIRKTGAYSAAQTGQAQGQTALPENSLVVEIEKTRARIHYFQKLYKEFLGFESVVFKFYDNGHDKHRIWDDYLKDDKKDLNVISGLFDLFKKSTLEKLNGLEEKLKCLETIAKY